MNDENMDFDEWMAQQEFVDSEESQPKSRDYSGDRKGRIEDIDGLVSAIMDMAPDHVVRQSITSTLMHMAKDLGENASIGTLKAIMNGVKGCHPPGEKAYRLDKNYKGKHVPEEREREFAERIQAVFEDFPELNAVCMAEGSVVVEGNGVSHSTVVLGDMDQHETSDSMDTCVELMRYGKASAFMALSARLKLGTQQTTDKGYDDGADE